MLVYILETLFIIMVVRYLFIISEWNTADNIIKDNKP